jgi:hypothetical protein
MSLRRDLAGLVPHPYQVVSDSASIDQALRVLRPVRPRRRSDIGVTDVPCGSCGAAVLQGWNTNALMHTAAAECWRCGGVSVDPRVYATIIAIEDR